MLNSYYNATNSYYNATTIALHGMATCDYKVARKAIPTGFRYFNIFDDWDDAMDDFEGLLTMEMDYDTVTSLDCEAVIRIRD